MKKRVGVLISGRGSNMRALVEASSDPLYPAKIVLVVSNVPNAPGLEFAQSQNIKTVVVNNNDHKTREAFDFALNAELQKHRLDIICCAGFMRIMTATLISNWTGKMLNIHPSLLPKFKGLHTHERALAAGEKQHGASVHFVTEELDGGEVIMQAQVPILPGDTHETLSNRVLAVEHPLYVEALRLVAIGAIQAKAS